MRYYAGLDVSMKETAICILNEEGKKVYESRSYSDPKPIYDELIKSGYPLEKVGLESGSLSSYLTKGLQALGSNTICIDSRKMAAILSVTVNKTDKNDARGIADAMRCNHYKETYIHADEDESMRILLQCRATLVNSRTTLKNTIRGHLKNYGIRLGEISHKSFSAKVRAYFPELLAAAVQGLESILKNYEILCEEIDKVDKFVQKTCQVNADVQRLMTVPGVGKVVALTFISAIGDPSRFQKSRAVGAYYGMTPRQYSSGETIKQGGISRCGSKEMRFLLMESAIVLLTRCKAWSSLKAWGMKVMRKHGLKKAAMAVGRKLGIILHRMLVTGENFRYSNIVD